MKYNIIKKSCCFGKKFININVIHKNRHQEEIPTEISGEAIGINAPAKTI
jgi:hypothetical protein